MLVYDLLGSCRAKMHQGIICTLLFNTVTSVTTMYTLEWPVEFMLMCCGSHIKTRCVELVSKLNASVLNSPWFMSSGCRRKTRLLNGEYKVYLYVVLIYVEAQCVELVLSLKMHQCLISTPWSIVNQHKTILKFY